MPVAETHEIAALIVAAGSGSRMGGRPKQYRALEGVPVLRRSVLTFLRLLPAEALRVAISPDHRAFYDEACGDLGLPPPITGGETRRESVAQGVEAFAGQPPHFLLIHDAARPFVSEALVARVIAALEDHAAVIPALPVTETIRQSEGEAWRTLDRSTLRAMQTPQGFHYDALRGAHRAWKGGDATDDGQVIEAAGQAVFLIEGEGENRKLTTPEDWAWAEARVARPRGPRVAQGVDVHRYRPHAAGEAKVLRLGGIDIPHETRLEGHSDADAVLHAITDALLGAAGEGDIGQLFPPSDARWKGADSRIFLEEAVARVLQGGGILRFLDVTVIAEVPKIGPHREAMRQAVAQMTGLAVSQINIKATTSEKMGFTGRKEGLAAMAVATLDWPLEAA